MREVCFKIFLKNGEKGIGKKAFLKEYVNFSASSQTYIVGDLGPQEKTQNQSKVFFFFLPIHRA